MEEKKKILSKFKDYRNELELVLEGKQFDEEAKSLILSIFYKLDNFYKDYASVKHDCDPKNKFLEDFINIIKLKCKSIKIISPREYDKKEKYSIDREKGEIKSLPIENVLLYAIYELNQNIKKNSRYLMENFVNTCVNYVLNKGKIINSIEPVRDFNGWSWTAQIDNSDNVIYNLIFQNMLFIFGYSFMYQNTNKSNITDILLKKVSASKLGNSGFEFLQYLIEMCIVLYNNSSIENHEECIKYKRGIVNKRNMLNTRKEYIKDKTKNNADIDDEIKKIDEMLENVQLLKKEYQNRIKEDKTRYFCMSDFVEKIERERENLIKKKANNSKLLDSRDYIKNHDDYQTEIELFKVVDENHEKINIQSKIIRLQKKFLECERIKIPRAETKKDLYNIARELRYYANVLYKKNKNTIDDEKILAEFENTTKLLIKRMLDDKIIDIGFKSEKLNYEVSKYIFRSKIIELANITLRLSFIDEKNINVEYMDEDVLDYKCTIQIPSEEEIINKKDKKIKLLKIGG